MKIEVTNQIIKEVEIELPAFMKSNCHFYKVISETECIVVTDLDGWYEIAQRHPSNAFMHGNVSSTEAEFKEAFAKVVKIFNKNL